MKIIKAKGSYYEDEVSFDFILRLHFKDKSKWNAKCNGSKHVIFQMSLDSSTTNLALIRQNLYLYSNNYYFIEHLLYYEPVTVLSASHGITHLIPLLTDEETETQHA